MSEPSPASTPPERVISAAVVGRLWTLTYVSLGLNGLILLLILVGVILHHHGGPSPRHFGGRDRGDGRFCCKMEPRDEGRFFHHFGMMGPGPRSGWGGFDRRPPGGGFGGGQGPMQGPRMMGGGGPGFAPRMMDGPQNTPPDPAKMTERMLNHLSTQLTLTDDQKAKIKPIIQDQVTQIQKEMETQRQARQKEMDDTKAKIKALLNTDQQKKLDAMPMPGQKPPPPPPQDQPKDDAPGQ
ncbi:MAG: hypothetical protein LV479_05240 [Methylacidiphilales bacterium]|nr:hypothetical protein [Candidatus Methylacidiphilales bacterium]